MSKNLNNWHCTLWIGWSCNITPFLFKRRSVLNERLHKNKCQITCSPILNSWNCVARCRTDTCILLSDRRLPWLHANSKHAVFSASSVWICCRLALGGNEPENGVATLKWLRRLLAPQAKVFWPMLKEIERFRVCWNFLLRKRYSDAFCVSAKIVGVTLNNFTTLNQLPPRQEVTDVYLQRPQFQTAE